MEKPKQRKMCLSTGIESLSSIREITPITVINFSTGDPIDEVKHKYCNNYFIIILYTAKSILFDAYIIEKIPN